MVHRKLALVIGQCLCVLLLLTSFATRASPPVNEDEHVEYSHIFVNETTPVTIRFDGKGKPTDIQRILKSLDPSCGVKITWTNASFDIGANRDSSLITWYAGPTGNVPLTDKYVFWVKQFEPLEQCVPEGCGMIWEYDCRREDCRLLGDSAYTVSIFNPISIHFKTDLGLNTTYFEFQYQLYCDEIPSRPPSPLHTVAPTRSPVVTNSPSRAPSQSPTTTPTKLNCKRFKNKKSCNRYKIEHNEDEVETKNGCQWSKKYKICQDIKC